MKLRALPERLAEMIERGDLKAQLIAPVQQTREHRGHLMTVKVTSIRITSPVTGSVAAIDWLVS